MLKLTAQEITTIRVAMLGNLTRLKKEFPAIYEERLAQHRSVMEKLWKMRREIENATPTL